MNGALKSKLNFAVYCKSLWAGKEISSLHNPRYDELCRRISFAVVTRVMNERLVVPISEGLARRTERVT